MQVIATGNTFSGNTAYYGAAMYTTNSLAGFTLSNNIFTQNTAYDGAAIYKKSIRMILTILILE